MEYSHSSDLTARAKQKRLSAPVASTAPERLKLTLQMQRLKCSELEHQLEEMKQEITKSSLLVDHELSNDLTSIIGDHTSGNDTIHESVLAAAKTIVKKQFNWCPISSHDYPILFITGCKVSFML